MRNDDRAEVLRGKARVLTYAQIMDVVRRAAQIDDGTTDNSNDGFAWNPECYPHEQARINEIGSSLGRILFAMGGCTAAAFDAFLPAFNEALEGTLEVRMARALELNA